MRLLSLAVVIAVPALAQTIYTWEDEDGVHATDDLSQVPRNQRNVERVQAEPPPSSGLSAPRPAPVAVAVAVDSAARPSGEREWRDVFIAAHRRIDSLRRAVSALEASLPQRVECVPQPAPLTVPAVPTGRPTARCYVNPLYDQLKVELGQRSVELKDAELDLEQLDRRASLEAVPREWRRGW